jgi:ABC-type branched-subunit amino acid transport system substrate-binding protein
MLVKTRWIALCCALALVATACGSRLSEEELSAGGGTGGGSAVAPDAGSGVDGAGIDNEGEDGPMVGTLPVPCGEGDAAPGPIPEGVEGASQDEIKIAVVSDRAGQIKVPTAGIEESVQAFVDWCNGFGGINGRQLALTKIDSKLFSHLEATQEACNAGVFAIVGSGSVSDNQGAQAMVDCGLIEVPAYTATAAKAMSDNMVQPLPNPSSIFNSAPAVYMVDNHPEAVKKAAILWGGIDTARVQAERIIEAYEQVGFEFVYQKETAVIQESYAAEAKAMKDAGVEYVNFVNSTAEAVKLLRDIDTQSVEPEVIEFGQQYYDPQLLEAGDAVEGALVQLNTVPFEEIDDSPGLQAYLAAYEAVGSDIEATSLGVQAWSAGLLFATATKTVGDDLTRENVLAALQEIDEWDGGGVHGPSNPGANLGAPCLIFAQVQDGAFVRAYPEEVATFDCKPDEYPIELEGDYGEGASAN